MIEYTSEMLKSNCDLDFISIIVKHVLRQDALAYRILQNFKEGKKTVFDITTDDLCKCIRQEYIYRKQNELSWKFALETIVKELKKIFVDANIYCENKEIFDVHDHITIHRLINIEL
tara:strand:+ start:158 stop:508 length:351 start_codon:yes stop_codon:yes gene_type:complete